MRSLRILSLDGGGVRGIISANFLRLWCIQFGIDPDKIFEYFDIIAGTSIGGIQAMAYSIGKSPTYVIDILSTKAKDIFNVSPVSQIHSGQAGTVTWTGYLTGAFNSLYYNTELVALCNETFGTSLISESKTNVLVTTFQTESSNGDAFNRARLLSNLNTKWTTGNNVSLKDAAMSTSAAPVYFPAWKTENDSYGSLKGTFIDGGVFMNNPVSMAQTIIESLYPDVLRVCVLSIGTGIGNLGYIPQDSQSLEVGIGGNLATIKSTFDISMSVPPEVTNIEMEAKSTARAGRMFYHRFQYLIPTEQNPDSSLDNPSDEFISYMKSSSEAVYNSEEHQLKIKSFMQHFLL